MRFSILLFIFFLKVNTSVAQIPTWSKQISCIIYSHCTGCHNPNGLAPFSLTTYAQVYGKRNSILNEVINNKMPPYLPDVNYSHMANARVLTEAEKTLISDWVNNGAPAGDTTTVLPPPVYAQTQVITNPDLTARIPSFTVPNISGDLYQAFVITNPLPVTRYITQVEVMPGNRNIVHHVLVYQDTTNRPVLLDSAYAGPGYVSFGGVGSNAAKLVATWVPGSNVYTLPTGMGIRLSAGARLVVQIHYPDGAAGLTDSTRINLKFSPTALRDVTIAPILNTNNLTNGPLFIPADSVRTFYSRFVVPTNVTVISIGPHAHLLCKKFEVYGKPLVGDTIKLIKIDDWDFHWQGSHNFQKPIKIPAGTVLHGKAMYDNTVNNPHNPSSPPQDVNLGEATTDEMMLIYFAYLPYQTGDENIIYDTTSHETHYLNCVPEPLALPLQLLSFEANNINNSAVLNWTTAQEKNVSHFEIERSYNGRNFIKTGHVKALNSSEVSNKYSFTDKTAESPSVYYRLKLIDFDSRYTYSPIRKVVFEKIDGVKIFPNPVYRGQHLILQSLPFNAMHAELFNAVGQRILFKSLNDSGTANIPISADINPGQYILKITCNNSTVIKKILIQ